MYIRQVKRQNKDGSVVTYVQLAHNVRDPRTGTPRAQVLYSFGRADQLDVEALKRLAKSIRRFLNPEDALRLQQEPQHGLRFLASRPMGGAWVLNHLWQELGIGRALNDLLTDRAHRGAVERAIFAMVANRALAPASKRQVEQWVKDQVALPGVEEIPLQQLYRAMDFLLEAHEQLQREVFWSVAHLLNLEVDLLYLDTTSTYFEIEPETVQDTTEDEQGRPQTLRRWGHSKDDKPLPQVVIGLAVTRDGIPVRCWVWPGNTADMSVVEEVKRDLSGWKLGRVITVVDRGFASEENLRVLQRPGGHFIAGEKLRSGKPAVETALSRRGRYQKIRENVYVKEIIVGNGEARQRYVLVFNPEQAKRDRQRRQQLLQQLRAELAQLRRLKGGPHTKAVCALRSHPTLGRYLTQTPRGELRVDMRKVKAEERLDGKYLLRTSDDTLSAGDVALGYKQLIEVEAAFRTLKNTLDLRPVYHRLDERIRAHVLLCWLALLLIRVAEIRTEQTWPTLRRALERMHLGQFCTPQGMIWQRTETTPDQAAIFRALKIPEPPLVLQIDSQAKSSA
ncbi:IS1634 family transposase [Hydrogenibacillus sp. N12]|uniref:IS1634 family transposase n=1 Tax=Hydrogenibacillus sp. N12 TaxID=2866627 RepID=UPI001C7CD83C|nr:IS1634 family transposase [Hydrogenibacillus sp. N12]QZA32175.1 IS1634 family transposase [Hydrogenibacillus sp. N12]